MRVQLCAKIEVSSITPTSFRQGKWFYPTLPESEPLKPPPRLWLRERKPRTSCWANINAGARQGSISFSVFHKIKILRNELNKCFGEDKQMDLLMKNEFLSSCKEISSALIFSRRETKKNMITIWFLTIAYQKVSIQNLVSRTLLSLTVCHSRNIQKLY